MARRHIAPRVSVLLVPLLLLSTGAGTVSARSSASRAARLRVVTLGVGYVPSVQFAPFYVAQARGYYRRAGLDVRFSYGFSPNLLQLVASGREQFAIGDGTDTIEAIAQGVRITPVASIYQKLPVAVFSLKKHGIRSLADLRGKRVGVPGRFGASYAALLAALHGAGISPSELTIRTIGYTQSENLVQGKVDAAVGYSSNEPVLLQRHGYRVSVIEVGTLTHLVGAGLVAGNSMIASSPGVVRAFVSATLLGLARTIDNPREAFALSRQVHGLTTLRGRDANDQYAVLLRSIAFWHDRATRLHGLGYADPAEWTQSIQTLRAIGQIARSPDPSRVVTNRFSAGAPAR